MLDFDLLEHKIFQCTWLGADERGQDEQRYVAHASDRRGEADEVRVLPGGLDQDNEVIGGSILLFNGALLLKPDVILRLVENPIMDSLNLGARDFRLLAQAVET